MKWPNTHGEVQGIRLIGVPTLHGRMPEQARVQLKIRPWAEILEKFLVYPTSQVIF